MKIKVLKLICYGIAILTLSGCNIGRLFEGSSGPELSPIEGTQEDKQQRAKFVSLPMPRVTADKFSANSLWRKGSRSFFKDQRASKVGDIVQVSVNFTDQASISNSTSLSRTAADNSNITSLGGLETSLENILPNEGSISPLSSLSASKSNSGAGSIDRSETLNFTMAAIVNEILPNGNMVIMGRQEVRVNYEKRELVIGGVIRPEDIDASNLVPSSKIAEARISYGGRGDISDLQAPRYGQKVLDVILPF